MLKKVAILSVILLLPLMAYAENQSPWEVKLPFEKATIEYSIRGVEDGVETLYIRNYGNTTARYRRSVMQVMGIEKVTATIDFIDPEWIYIYDLQGKTATKTTNPRKYLAEEYQRLSDSEKEQVQRNSEELGFGLFFGGMSGEIEKNAMTILDINCDKIQFMGTTIYAIHGSDIALKSESNIMGMITLTEATSLNKGFAPDNYFQHPVEITAVIDPEADAISHSMAQEIIRRLSDPKASEKDVFPESKNYLKPDPEEQENMEKALEALKDIFE
jgi:hypothetical protein